MSKKGWEHPKKIKKVEKFKNGLPILCKIHGEHLRWRMHTGNNVQCLHCASMYQRNRKLKDPIKTLWRDAKHHSKGKNWSFELSAEEIQTKLDLQNNQCCLSGKQFSKENLPSLDRKDSEIGYTLDNIQLVQIKINRMKSNMKEQEFISICKEIADYSAKKGKK